MVAAAPVYPYPHPAFPEALLPDGIKSKLQKGSKPHYPQSVLDKQKPLDSPAHDVSCQACCSFVKVFSSAFSICYLKLQIVVALADDVELSPRGEA